jgi:probable HAF family extracellular repeat protein
MALIMADLITRPAAAEPTSPKPVYTLTDLGTLGGSTSIARDINDSGHVTGQSQTASGQNLGFLWQDDGKGMKPIHTLGGSTITTSPARGINKHGQVVGFSRIPDEPNQPRNRVRAYLAQDGRTTPLGTLTEEVYDSATNTTTTTTFSNSEAWSINDDGVAVGRSFNSGSQGRAVLWRDGQTSNPEDLSGALKARFSETAYSEAWSINDDRQVVGEVGKVDQQAKAFLYEKGTDGADDKVTDIDAAGRQDPDHPVFPYPYSEAQAINDHGQVVGWYYRTTTPSPEGQAFLYEKGANGTETVAPLNPLDGDLYSRARDINATGRAVGWSRGTVGNERLQFSAVLWQDKQVTDLNDLIPADSRWRLTNDGIKGWTLTDAYAINASGQIVGAGFKDGKDENLMQLRAFLLTPDTTKPKIECGTADGDWHDEDVSITCTASDGGVGLADPTTDASFTLSTSVPAETEISDARTDSRQVCDAAGNCATAGPVGGNKVDKKAPAISISTSPGGDEYELGDDVTVSYDCTDGGSGTASCSGPAASGGKLDTASVGQHTFTVEATDRVGNIGSQPFVYQVIYDFGGFLGPVDNLDVATNKAKAGSSIPVTFSLGGDQGLDIFATGTNTTTNETFTYPTSTAMTCDSTDQLDAIEETVSAGGSSLQYDSSLDQYTYVWKTEKPWAGSCRQLVVKLDDGTYHRANFKFVK